MVRSLAIYLSLGAQGYDPVFISGIKREGEQLKGHAWVELNGKAIQGFGDEQARQQYQITFQYPAKAS